MNYWDIERAELARDKLMEAYDHLGDIYHHSMTPVFKATGTALSELDEWIATHKRTAYRVEVQAVVSVPVYVWAEDEAKACELARELVEAKLTAQPLDIDDVDTDIYMSEEAEDMQADTCDIQQGDDQ